VSSPYFAGRMNYAEWNFIVDCPPAESAIAAASLTAPRPSQARANESKNRRHQLRRHSTHSELEFTASLHLLQRRITKDAWAAASAFSQHIHILDIIDPTSSVQQSTSLLSTGSTKLDVL
jgi:hypothetical protein